MSRPVRLLAGLLAVLAIGLVGTANPAGATPGPPDAPEWWFDSWQVPQLWAGGANGSGIIVAVIATGVDAELPELRGKVLPGADFIGNHTDGRTDFDSEDFSHGTAMTSIIAADRGFGNIEGLAPGVRILPIAVPLHGVVRHGTPPSNATAKAIDYAVGHGAKIINMSLGGVRDETEDGPDPCPGAVQQSVLHAIRAGALVVAASGNSGDDNSPVEEPGVCLGVVSVGAVDRNLDVTSFSSRHPYLTVSAPGDNVPSLSRNAAYIGEGTSQATALTSAALALIWSKYPHETNRQVLSRLLDTATDRGPTGRDPSYGYGVIQPAAAIATAAPAATAKNPVLDAVQPLITSAAGIPRLAAAGAAHPRLGLYQVRPPRTGPDGRLITLATLAIGALLLALVLLARYRRQRRSPAVAGAA